MAKPRASARPEKRPNPRRTFEIALTGELDGFHVTMASMSGKDIIAVRKGSMTEVQMLEFVSNHCLAHDFDAESLQDLDYWITIEVLRQWSAAIREDALPQPKGDS